MSLPKIFTRITAYFVNWSIELSARLLVGSDIKIGSWNVSIPIQGLIVVYR